MTAAKPCIYVSGPMTGYADWNFPEFNRVAALLRRAGYPVVNPADFGANPDQSWRDCLRRDLVVLMSCEAVALLDGWDRSKGARLEVHVASELGIPIKPYREWRV